MTATGVFSFESILTGPDEKGGLVAEITFTAQVLY